jgi:hypothetical protein
MIEGGAEGQGERIFAPNLYPERPLAGGGEEGFGVQRERVAALHIRVKAGDSGGGQEDAVPVVVFAEFAQAGIHVASDGDNAEVCAKAKQFGHAARAARGEGGPFREILEGKAGVFRDEEVAWILAFGDGGEGQVFRLFHR